MKNILILIFLYALNPSLGFTQEKTNVEITGKLLNKISNIIIRTYSDNSTIKAAKIQIPSFETDSTFSFKFYLAKPGLVVLINQTIYCEPGDSINVLISGKLPFPKMVFTGSKAYHYNYFSNLVELNSTLNEIERKELSVLPKENNMLLAYKGKLIKQYNKRDSFLTSYNAKYPVSENFKQLTYAENYYQNYVYYLLSRYSSVKNIEDKIKINYFVGITPQKLQNNDFIQSLNYSFALFIAVKDYWAKAKTGDTYAETFNKQLTFIKKEFVGETKDILIAKLLCYYFERGIKDYKQTLLNAYENSKNNFINSIYYKNLEPYYRKYMLFDVELSKDFKTSIKLFNGETSTIGSLIETLKGNVIYIDLWASWCGPCIAEMPFTAKLKKKFENKNVKFIYLSTDKSKPDWQKAFEELKMDNTSSFLLEETRKDEFLKRINLVGIPRYILINKEGKIIDGDAPRPSERKLEVMINNELLKK